jgi:hypothetical protein
MVFDRDRDPSDELEDYGDELTSDYREEGEEGEERVRALKTSRTKCPTRSKRPQRG